MEETPANLMHTLIHQLSAVYARESDQILLEQFGIGFSQFKIMSTLQNNLASQQKHIAFALGQTEASISRQVKLLIRKGMLTVSVNPRNRREHITELTSKGSRMIEAANEVLQTYQLKSIEHIPHKQQTQLLELLAKLHT
jgi:DNA-binding MarR family transcriptional regulator